MVRKMVMWDYTLYGTIQSPFTQAAAEVFQMGKGLSLLLVLIYGVWAYHTLLHSSEGQCWLGTSKPNQFYFIWKFHNCV